MVIIPAVVGRVVRQSHNPIRAALAVVIAATAASWITSARLLYVRVRTKFRGPQRCLHRRRAGARALLAPTGRRWQHPGRWVGALAATQETVNCSEEHEAARGRFRRLRRRRDGRPLGRARRGGDPGIVRLSPHHVYRHTSSAPHLPRAALRRAHLRPKQGMAAQQHTHRSDNAHVAGACAPPRQRPAGPPARGSAAGRPRPRGRVPRRPATLRGGGRRRGGGLVPRAVTRFGSTRNTSAPFTRSLRDVVCALVRNASLRRRTRIHGDVLNAIKASRYCNGYTQLRNPAESLRRARRAGLGRAPQRWARALAPGRCAPARAP